MNTNCSISFIAEIATVISAIAALVSMIYTIRVYKKAKIIQESVDFEKVERYVGSLMSMNNYLSYLSYHFEDGLSGKELRALESRVGHLVKRIDRFKLFFSKSALSEQEKLKTQLKDCLASCQDWTEVHTNDPEARVDDYIKQILEASASKIHKQIDKVITEIRCSSIT